MNMKKEMNYKQEVDRWWDKFEQLDALPQMVAAVKEVASQKREKEFYQELCIGDAIFDSIEPEFFKHNDLEGYAKFLESLHDDFPNIFDLNAAWHLRWLIKYYVHKAQFEKIKSMSGGLEACVQVGFEDGWVNTRLLNGEFQFRDCSIVHDGLFFVID